MLVNCCFVAVTNKLVTKKKKKIDTCNIQLRIN